MKYLATLSLLMLVFVGAIAQDRSAAELKNEGNAALKAKDYKTALGLYEGALAAWEDETDDALVYNTATCAYKTKDYDKALKYYAEAKELGYKGDACVYYMYKSYKVKGNAAEQTKLYEDAVANFPNSKYTTGIKKDVVKPMVKEAKGIYTEAQSKLNTRTSDNADQWGAIKAESVKLCDEAIAKCDEILAIYAADKNAKAIKAGAEALKAAE